MPVFIDIHTHAVPGDADVSALLSVGTADLPSDYPWIAAAVHPWDTGKVDTAVRLTHVEAAADAGRLSAVGETGLDRSKGGPYEAQLDVFRAQLDIAERNGLPVVIHAVRSYSDLLAERTARSSPTPWIVHGYTGSAETVRQLLRAGCHLSFGTRLLQASPRQLAALRTVPAERLFLETDMSEAHIRTVYIAAAAERACSVEDLAAQCLENAKQIWKDMPW